MLIDKKKKNLGTARGNSLRAIKKDRNALYASGKKKWGSGMEGTKKVGAMTLKIVELFQRHTEHYDLF